MTHQQFRSRLLRDEDDLTAFSCGNDRLDDWIHGLAHTARERGCSNVFISCTDDGTVEGLYTLSPYSVRRNLLHGRVARNTPVEVPMYLLGILAVDRRFQGREVGKGLLREALGRVEDADIRARALAVHPVDPAAAGFYRAAGFRECGQGGHLLVFPLGRP